RQVAHQVGEEEDRALEHADEEQVASLVVRRDLGAELRDAPLEILLLDQDLRHRPVELSRGQPAPPDARRCPAPPRPRRRARRAAMPPAPNAAPSRRRTRPGSCASYPPTGPLASIRAL